MSTPPSAVILRRRLLLGGVLAVTLLGGVFASMWRGPSGPATALDETNSVNSVSSGEWLQVARGQLAAGHFIKAITTAESAFDADSENVAALIVAGEAATKLGRMDDALVTYARVPASHPQEYRIAQVASAEIERVAGSIDAAMTHYERVLQLDPGNALAVLRLAELYRMTGFTSLAEPLLMQMVRQGTCQVDQLQWLADPERPLLVLEYLEESLKRSPKQAAPHLGLARIWYSRGEFPTALDHLNVARQIRPGTAEIEITFGRVLLDLGRVDDWQRWLENLPPGIKTQPQIWLQQAIMAEHLGQKAADCRCALEAVSAAPHLQEAVYRAARLLGELGQKEAAAPLLKRNALLGEVAAMAAGIQSESPEAEACRREAEALLALGRDAEALAWGAFAVRAKPTNRSWFEGLQTRVASGKSAGDETATEDWGVALASLKSSYPLPEFRLSVGGAEPPRTMAGGTTLSFVDEAHQAGIDFTYEDSADPTTEGRRMFELTGGGVAVLDYDQDGWPDLYVTQGAKIVAGRATGSHLDQVYRNRGGQAFAKVTEGTRIVETDYSQGATAGDFNNDGFPDVYVANLGQNRLFENLGDGTFVEVGLPEDAQWTTSCAIADLNQDSIPDLYDANYVQGAEVFEKTCNTANGPRICTPYAFEAAPDRLCLGNGDGTFRDVTATAEISPPCGKGLGLLIGPLDETPGVDIFVANDTAANSLFVNENAPGEAPHYRDLATLAGVAFGDDGKPQACMGIAAADFDSDGTLDLHVTNFVNESNALYMSGAPGVYEDRSRDAGLRSSSLPMLGFGTQAIDVDLDGDMDLVVTNGDIDDFSHEGRAFRMRPQVYRNDGGHFTEVVSEDARDYFSRQSTHRGRGLARLDWNGDGREDFVVTHLDEPLALVTNRTKSSRRMMTLRLIGTSSSRDAIGATATFQIPGKSTPLSVSHVVTGDGFQSRNEAKVRFVVPANLEEIQVTVHWAHGLADQKKIDFRVSSPLVTECCVEFGKR